MKKPLILGALIAMLLPAAMSAESAQTISYGFWDANQRPAIESLVKAFEKENPSIKVDMQIVPWNDYWTKLQAAVAGGQAFDVFWMNGPFFPIYASQGVLKEMGGEFKKAGVDTAKYPKALVAMYSYGGKVFGLPKDYDTQGLYYNKDLFDKAKLSYPTADWTWDDLRNAAKKLTDAKAGVWGYASTTADQSGWWNFVYSNGGQLLSPDSSKVLVGEGAARDALAYLYGFVKDGLSPDGSTMASVDPWMQLFPNGKVAMIVGGSWMAKTYSQAPCKIDVAPLPKGKAGRATIIHGVANVVWSKSPKSAAAVKFAAFLSSKKAQEIIAASGSVIPAYEDLSGMWVKSLPTMRAQVLIDAAKYGVPYPASVRGMEWNDKITAVLADIWNGVTPFDEGMKKVVADGDAALQAAAR